MSEITKCPDKGDLLEVINCPTNGSCRLYDMEPESMKHANDDVYGHKLVTEKYKTLDIGDHMVVLHFFSGPEFIRFIPRETIHDNVEGDLKGYAAYILYDEKLWATKVFKSLEEFYEVFKIVSSNTEAVQP